MTAEGLKCRECGADYPLEALYVCERCFGPLEVAYHHEAGRDVAETPTRLSRRFCDLRADREGSGAVGARGEIENVGDRR